MINQARLAAARVSSGVDGAHERAVDRLVRCARLAPDAADTLEWAAGTLDTHGATSSDEVACRLLRAARARLDARAGESAKGRRSRERPAWI